jgi:hypothetical protein
MCQIRISCSLGETIQAASSIQIDADAADISSLHQIVPGGMSSNPLGFGCISYLDQISMWCESYRCPCGDICWKIKKGVAFMMLAHLHKVLGTRV